MEYKDYYQTLGVKKDASADDIKKAYRKLVRKYHPDVSKAKDADQKTKEINEAYAVLGDAEKRAAYDALGSNMHAGQPFQPPPDWGGGDFGGFGGASAEDVFADLFAHVGRRGRARGGFAMRGEDVHASMAIDLQDSYRGAHHMVSLRTQERERSIEVQIPKGILPGQQIRLPGQGQDGVHGGPPGDLVLEVSFRPDPHYRVEGRHVFRDLAVAPWEAALGAHIDVPTPAGQVEVAVPPGSQPGRKLRLKGRGIPGQPPGDLYLVLEVVLPPASSARARELYQAMARDLAFNPRAGAGR
ncbi:DnaJ C-terminal domain-containing protein [Massilia sp. CF038]|uniref:DnaJ C-terminal domain-containing protein n=1 Tax=Massilia sp. CF038 TaxID=1881045 RepID=UPI000917A3E0|nr:DnaJ C-terminal domain-containing protein [Massilia sp. CF038]SHH16192.1 curved DNA-binding protein [Massilia sp. CF038]